MIKQIEGLLSLTGYEPDISLDAAKLIALRADTLGTKGSSGVASEMEALGLGS